MNQHVNFYVMFINASCVMLYTLFYEKRNISFNIDLWFGEVFCYEFLLEMTTKTTTMNKRLNIFCLHSQISNKHKRVGWYLVLGVL